MGLMHVLNPDDPVLEEPAARDLFDKILGTDHLFLFVMEEEGALLASCYLIISQNLTRGGAPFATIENVVTAKEARRKGYGKAIIHHARDKARELGCYKIMLMTGSKTPGTHKFYRECGFDPDAKTAYLMRP